jgi:hypothetical protein
MEKCLGCEIVAGRIKTPGGLIYQDDFWTVTHATFLYNAPDPSCLTPAPYALLDSPRKSA